MTEIRFKKGEFVALRAVHDIRVQLDGDPSVIYKDDIIQYDGHTIIVDGARYRLGTLKGAVQKRWLVPPEDTSSVYVPESAVSKLSPADRTKTEVPSDVNLVTVQDEERVVGHYKGEKKVLRDTSTLRVKTSSEEDGIVVARLKNPARTEFQLKDGVDAEKREREVVKGTVKEILVPAEQVVGRVGDSLSDVFPEAASSADHYPPAGVAGDNDEVDSRNKVRREQALKEAQERRKQRVREFGETEEEQEKWVGKALVSSEREAEQEEPAESMSIRTSVGIDWDLSLHWRKRAKLACERYGRSNEILESIIAVEQEGVANFIREYMERKDLAEGQEEFEPEESTIEEIESRSIMVDSDEETLKALEG